MEKPWLTEYDTGVPATSITPMYPSNNSCSMRQPNTQTSRQRFSALS